MTPEQMKLKTYPVITLHAGTDNDPVQVTGVLVRRRGHDKADVIPLMDHGALYWGESITIANRAGKIVVTKRGEEVSE